MRVAVSLGQRPKQNNWRKQKPSTTKEDHQNAQKQQ